MFGKKAEDSKRTLIESFRTILVMVILSFILRFSVSLAHQILLQQGIADEVLRFHVLANSDSEEDQRVKYVVRDEVLDWLQAAMEEEDAGISAVGSGGSSPPDRQQTLDFLAGHLEALERAADQALIREGADYRAEAVIETCWFPDRTYGECTFPAGYYEALRLKLGEAQGQNWWCVLYPRLCFQDCVHAVVEEDQMVQLEGVLTEEEYESLLKEPSGWKIAFRWF